MQAADTGIFYAIEGIDGAGSSTQAQLLHEYLKQQGHTVHLTCEPTGMPIGKLLREFLRSQHNVATPAACLALLFAADRMQHVAQEIVPALRKGEHVICDRYVLSSLVYQGQQLPVSWVQQLNLYACAPNVTILIDTGSNEAEKRRQSRSQAKELFENEELQRCLRQRYCDLLAASDIRVDGSGSRKQVFDNMLQLLKQKGCLPS